MATVIQSPTAAQLANFCGSDQKLIQDFLKLFTVQGLFPGMVIWSAAAANAMAIALPANGAAVSRQLYKSLFNAIASPVTISHASPAVVAWTANGLPANAAIYFTTTGALPSPLVVGTKYFVKTAGASSFTISATAGGAAIATTTNGSGTHTAYPYGIGDGTTTFNVPNEPADSAGVNAYVVF